MTNGEPAQQHDLAEIPQCQPVAQPAKHHECNDLARQRRAVQYAVATLVELPLAVPASEPTIALRRQFGSLGHGRRAAGYAVHRNRPQFNGNSAEARSIPLPTVNGATRDRTTEIASPSINQRAAVSHNPFSHQFSPKTRSGNRPSWYEFVGSLTESKVYMLVAPQEFY